MPNYVSNGGDWKQVADVVETEQKAVKAIEVVMEASPEVKSEGTVVKPKKRRKRTPKK